MNRKERRTAEKQMGKENMEKINLMLNLPTECLTCKKSYDKLSKEMAMTWFVEVFNELKRVDLYCPECQEKRKNELQQKQSSTNV
jgi:ribosomal protein L44E